MKGKQAYGTTYCNFYEVTLGKDYDKNDKEGGFFDFVPFVEKK